MKRAKTLALSILVLVAAPVSGQDAPALEIITRSDNGHVYVYHNESVPMGHSMNVLRKVGAGEFEQLNKEPVRGAWRGAEFHQRVGDLYPKLSRDLRRDNPTAVFLRLKSDPQTGLLYTYLYPEVGAALGRLYIDQRAPASGAVTYRVEFLDDRGATTGKGLERTTTLSPSSPQQVRNLLVENDDRTINVSWDYPQSRSGNRDHVVAFEVTAYDSVARTAIDLPKSRILRNSAQTTFSYRIAKTSDSGAASVTVLAVDATGQTSPVATQSVRLRDQLAPVALGDVAANIVEGTHVQVSWNVSIDQDAVGYHVFRSRNADGPFDRLTEKPQTLLETIYLDRVPSNRGIYYYRVTVLDAAGNESDFSTGAATVQMNDRMAPAGPVAASARWDGRAVQVSWDDPERAPDLLSYAVYRKHLGRLSADSWTQVNPDTYTKQTILDDGEADKGFDDGALYRYAVVAYDSSRNASDTAMVDIKIPDVTAPVTPDTVLVSNSEFRAMVTWTATPSPDVGEYVVYKQEGGGPASEYRRFPAMTRFFIDEKVETGGTYMYSVSAVDTLGNESQRSRISSLTMAESTPPRRVRNAVAEASSNGVAIRWEPVKSPDLAGYRVYRSEIPTGTFEPVNVELVDQTAWFDGGGAANMWYRVHSIDKSGNESRPGKATRAR